MGSERRIFSATECVSAVEGHPRSLIVASIERACATSYLSLIVTLVLSCTELPLSNYLLLIYFRVCLRWFTPWFTHVTSGEVWEAE